MWGTPSTSMLVHVSSFYFYILAKLNIVIRTKGIKYWRQVQRTVQKYIEGCIIISGGVVVLAEHKSPHDMDDVINNNGGQRIGKMALGEVDKISKPTPIMDVLQVCRPCGQYLWSSLVD